MTDDKIGLKLLNGLFRRAWIVLLVLGILLFFAGMLAANQMPTKTGFWGMALIKQSEGFMPCKYDDGVGVITIGYGHTRSVKELPKCIGYRKAETLLRGDLRPTERCIIYNVDVALSQSQFDALSSFIFNLGCGNFSRSTLLRVLNDADYDAAAGQFHRWNRAGGKVWEGLVKRRARERWLFES